MEELRLDDENKWSEWCKEEVLLVDKFIKDLKA